MRKVDILKKKKTKSIAIKELPFEIVDALTIYSLNESLKMVTDGKFPDPDYPEIAAACRRLLKWYGG